MKPKIPERIAVARTEALIAAGAKERMQYIQQNIGVKKEIILESLEEEGAMTGMTADYLRVYLPGIASTVNRQVVQGIIKPLCDSSLANLFDVEADILEA